MDRKLLVLDLDETLLHSSERTLGRRADFMIGPDIHVYRRPHWDTFLAYAFEHFQVGVWTAATTPYAVEAVNGLFRRYGPPVFLWTRERCTVRQDPNTGRMYWIKNLAKVKRRGFDLDQVLAVDDCAENYERNYGNLINIEAYTGRADDDELLALIDFLERLRDVKSVRKVEKRSWRQAVRR